MDDTPVTIPSPLGFYTHVASIGIRDESQDFVIIAANEPCTAAGVFTKSLFSGPSVKLSKKHLSDSKLRAIVTVSKNANVANGAKGDSDAMAVVCEVARVLKCEPDEVAIGSTGVIGRPYPMQRLTNHLSSLAAPFPTCDLAAAARAIMTTDTFPKVSCVQVGPVTVTGIAKGVGMIEPDMATMLAYILTDAEIGAEELDAMFRRVVDKTFNSVSIDTDTSTSDTAILLASGMAGTIDAADLEAALYKVALDLTKQIARDGEGATKLLEVRVDQAKDAIQAKRVAKAIVNSPLVKTAVHGADPNWGRVIMAIGKCSDESDIDPDAVTVNFGGIVVFPEPQGGVSLQDLSKYMQSDEVVIGVSLGNGESTAVVWGCDLSAGYVRINADYTT